MAACRARRTCSLALVALVLLSLCGGGLANLVELKTHYSLIQDAHNDLRRAVVPKASDMREITWDGALAADAARWAGYCRYTRPPHNMYGWGSNLHFTRGYPRTWNQVRTHIKHGLHAWSREKRYFRYGDDCGLACSYVQMIYSSAYRVGCALNRCANVFTRGGVERRSSIFVCFYAPRGGLMETYPYRSGEACSQCPKGTGCSAGLCVEQVPLVGALEQPQALTRPADNTDNALPTLADRLPLPVSADALTREEEDFILMQHNRYRRDEGQADLSWDGRLNDWTNWIIHCKTDYPGPPYGYTNFYRAPDHMPVYEAVYQWAREGRDTNVKMDKGCRTPYDRTQCNHFTNMVEAGVSRMACSAKNCGRGDRQLVCVYDNPKDRRYARRRARRKARGFALRAQP